MASSFALQSIDLSTRHLGLTQRTLCFSLKFLLKALACVSAKEQREDDRQQSSRQVLVALLSLYE